MSDPGYSYIDETGVIVPDTANLQATVIGEYQTALKDDNLPTAPETPQGALIVAETLARSNVLGNNAAVANQFNPNQSGGIALEALCRLTGLEPPVSTPTLIVGVAVTGVTNTTIPALSQVKPSNDPDAPLFQTIGAVTIMNSIGVVTLQALVGGPTAAPDGAWVIVSDVLGWETVSNTAGVVTLGSDKLSDAALRALRDDTLALQGISLPEAITSALNDTPGVQSIQFRENIKNTTQTIDGIVMVAKSIWACVNGGTDVDVAFALLGAKSLGADFNGTVGPIDTLDPTTGQTYPVTFDRPDVIEIWVRVTAKAATITGDPYTLISQAVLDYQAGVIEGAPGFKVGVDASPFEIGYAVGTEVQGIFLTKVEVSTDGVTYQTTDLAIAINEIAAVTAGRITAVTV